MAYFPVNPNNFDTTTIAAHQANPGDGPWLVTSDFGTWIDNNQPLSFVIASGNIYIDIPDYNPSCILDYMTNWPMPS